MWVTLPPSGLPSSPSLWDPRFPFARYLCEPPPHTGLQVQMLGTGPAPGPGPARLPGGEHRERPGARRHSDGVRGPPHPPNHMAPGPQAWGKAALCL